MTKKFLLFFAIAFYLGVGTNVGLATNLGWWNEGDPGSTHQFWDFTPGFIKPSGWGGYTADPEIVSNPFPNRVVATITPFAGTWDGSSRITAILGIFVALEIPNYENRNEYKEIWVDIGNAAATSITVSATNGGSTTFDYSVLPGQGAAEFGVKIWPNPYVEKINFMIWGTPNAYAVLDYIHVDTICIPEPATIALLTIGALGFLKRKSGK
jgi:hypothetical protein